MKNNNSTFHFSKNIWKTLSFSLIFNVFVFNIYTMSEVQSIFFNSSKYNTRQARTYLKKHDYKPLKKVHQTPNGLKYRLQLPSKYKDFRSEKIDDGNIILIY